MSDSHYSGRFDRANGLRSDLETALAFLRPELLALDATKLQSFIDQEPVLQSYCHYFDNVLSKKPHLLSPSEETLLAEAGIMTSSPRTIHCMLIDADMPFGTVPDVQGNRVPVSRAEYERAIRSSNRRLDELEKLLPA